VEKVSSSTLRRQSAPYVAISRYVSYTVVVKYATVLHVCFAFLFGNFYLLLQIKTATMSVLIIVHVVIE